MTPPKKFFAVKTCQAKYWPGAPQEYNKLAMLDNLSKLKPAWEKFKLDKTKQNFMQQH